MDWSHLHFSCPDRTAGTSVYPPTGAALVCHLTHNRPGAYSKERKSIIFAALSHVWALFLSLLFLGVTNSVAEDKFPTDRQLQMIEIGRSYTLAGDYSRADSVFSAYISEYPHHPSGYFYRATARKAGVMGCDADLSATLFVGMLWKAVTSARSLLSRDPTDLLARTYEGTALGLLGAHYAHQGRYWDGWWTSKKGVKILESVIEADSSFADAYLGLGVYYFWLANEASAFLWLPFLSDTRSEGVKFLQRCMVKSALFGAMAKSMLVWVLIEQREHGQALALADSVLKEHPDGLGWLWARAEALMGLQRWSDAAGAFSRAFATYPPERQECHGAVELLFKLGKSAHMAGDRLLAVRSLTRFLSTPTPVALEDVFDPMRGEARTILSSH